MKGNVALLTDTIKLALVNGYTPNKDTDNAWNDVADNGGSNNKEIAAADNYATGGATIANKAVAVDTTADTVKFTFDPVTWSSSTLTASGAVLYKVGSDQANSPLIAFLDFTSAVSSNAGDFTVSVTTPLTFQN